MKIKFALTFVARSIQDPKYEVQSEGLLIRNVTRADQGSYKCKATQMEDGITDFRDMVVALRVQREFCCIFSPSFLLFGGKLGVCFFAEKYSKRPRRGAAVRTC